MQRTAQGGVLLPLRCSISTAAVVCTTVRLPPCSSCPLPPSQRREHTRKGKAMRTFLPVDACSTCTWPLRQPRAAARHVGGMSSHEETRGRFRGQSPTTLPALPTLGPAEPLLMASEAHLKVVTTTSSSPSPSTSPNTGFCGTGRGSQGPTGMGCVVARKWPGRRAMLSCARGVSKWRAKQAAAGPAPAQQLASRALTHAVDLRLQVRLPDLLALRSEGLRNR